MTVDHSRFKLGKQPVRVDLRTRKLSSYLTPDLPEPPAAISWHEKMSGVPMLLNDQIGLCTRAALAHMVQCWTANNGAEHCPSEVEVLAAFIATSGYDPADPSSDRGDTMLNALNHFRKVGIGGHGSVGYVSISPQKRREFKIAIHHGGGAYLGLDLPVSAQRQLRWQVALSGLLGDTTPGSWGGHAVAAHGYDEDGLWISTWDGFKKLAWSWVDAGYCSEGYMIVSRDWARPGELAPSGFDEAALLAELPAVAR